MGQDLTKRFVTNMKQISGPKSPNRLGLKIQAEEILEIQNPTCPNPFATKDIDFEYLSLDVILQLHRIAILTLFY